MQLSFLSLNILELNPFNTLVSTHFCNETRLFMISLSQGGFWAPLVVSRRCDRRRYAEIFSCNVLLIYSLVCCLRNLHNRPRCFCFFGIIKLEKGSRISVALSR